GYSGDPSEHWVAMLPQNSEQPLFLVRTQAAVTPFSWARLANVLDGIIGKSQPPLLYGNGVKVSK
ncbi:hypothetical protein SB773_34780, partial [Bacillus sp. SIMBA_074]